MIDRRVPNVAANKSCESRAAEMIFPFATVVDNMFCVVALSTPASKMAKPATPVLIANAAMMPAERRVIRRSKALTETSCRSKS